jgi:hypothetical protein
VESPKFENVVLGAVTLIFKEEELVRRSSQSGKLTAANCHLETSIAMILEKYGGSVVGDYSGGGKTVDQRALSSFSLLFGNERNANNAVEEFSALPGVRAVYRTPLVSPG